MTLTGEELLRRFLLHVLPKGLMRVRHFGFLANRCRARRLAEIRTALEAPAPAADEETETAAPFDGYPCPACRTGRLRVIAHLAPPRRARACRCVQRGHCGSSHATGDKAQFDG